MRLSGDGIHLLCELFGNDSTKIGHSYRGYSCGCNTAHHVPDRCLRCVVVRSDIDDAQPIALYSVTQPILEGAARDSAAVNGGGPLAAKVTVTPSAEPQPESIARARTTEYAKGNRVIGLYLSEDGTAWAT